MADDAAAGFGCEDLWADPTQGCLRPVSYTAGGREVGDQRESGRDSAISEGRWPMMPRPASVVKICGLTRPKDVYALSLIQLVGERLVTSENPGETVRYLRGDGR